MVHFTNYTELPITKCQNSGIIMINIQEHCSTMVHIQENMVLSSVYKNDGITMVK